MKKKNNLKFLLSLCLLGSGMSFLSAENVKASKGKEPTEIIKSLEQRKDISEQLQQLSELSDEQLGHRKIQPLLLILLQDNKLNKSDRLEVFKLVADLAITREILSQDEAAETFLKVEPALTSPNLKLLCVETLLDFDALKNSATEAKISALVQNIINDASLEVAKQKYPASLHAACLHSLNGSNVSATQIVNIEKLLGNMAELSPALRIALYEVIGNLSESKPASLKKSSKNNFAKILVDILSAQPAMAQIGASDTELTCLKALLPAVGKTLADEDNIASLEKGVVELAKGLRHKDLDVVRLSGQAILALARSNSPKYKFELDTELLKCFGEVEAKASDANLREGIYLELLSASLGQILAVTDARTVETRIENIIAFAHRTVMTHPNIEIRIKGLDVLFVIEPKNFESKNLNAASRKTLKTLVLDCASAMDNAQVKQSLPHLVQRMGEVLHEITGRDFGTEGKLWNDWLRKDGKDFF